MDKKSKSMSIKTQTKYGNTRKILRDMKNVQQICKHLYINI